MTINTTATEENIIIKKKQVVNSKSKYDRTKRYVFWTLVCNHCVRLVD